MAKLKMEDVAEVWECPQGHPYYSPVPLKEAGCGKCGKMVGRKNRMKRVKYRTKRGRLVNG